MDKDASKATEKRLTNDRRKAKDSAYGGDERRKGDRRQPKAPSAA
jgi:hypothetical protein